MEIYSPIVTGSGAFVLHNNLANKVQNYTIRGIDPKWALITPALGRFSKDCDFDSYRSGYGECRFDRSESGCAYLP